MKLSKCLDLLVISLRSEGRSESTATWYQRRLGRLIAFLGDPEAEAVTLEDLRRFLAYLHSVDWRYSDHRFKRPQQGALSPFTIQGYLRCIKRLYGWLVESGYLTPTQNITAKLKRQSLPRVVPKEISEEDLRAMISGARTSRYPERDYALLLTLTDSGCRVGGLVGLKLTDLDLIEERIRVLEKGRKSRFVFLSSPTVTAFDMR